MLKTPLFAAAIGMALITAPAFADESESRSVAVKYKDLDLSSAEGQKELDRRIDRAAAEVCDANRIMTGTRLRSQERLQCADEARASIQKQIAQKTGNDSLGG